MAGRIAQLPGAEKVFRRGLIARDPAEIAATLGVDGGLISGEMSGEIAEAVAQPRGRNPARPTRSPCSLKIQLIALGFLKYSG